LKYGDSKDKKESAILLSDSGNVTDLTAWLALRLRCPHCKRRFRPQDFFLVEAAPQWSVFQLRCAMCHSQRLVLGARTRNRIRAYALELDAEEWNFYRRAPRLDADDVVRIARMLKTYDGDFSDVLEDPFFEQTER